SSEGIPATRTAAESAGSTGSKRITAPRSVHESMTTDGTTTTQLEIVEPMGEACMMGVQFAFDVATALF
ncbi:hypothetical protein, partial [Halalkalicoccus jeotgali]